MISLPIPKIFLPVPSLNRNTQVEEYIMEPASYTANLLGLN